MLIKLFEAHSHLSICCGLAVILIETVCHAKLTLVSVPMNDFKQCVLLIISWFGIIVM